ncbi:MAG: hypothetical protein PF690_14685 [Deltaproteobacteria bacterium]|jgi:hypothetical protein|nr:hypothetical protein [Deltaproteobacteria bacterium]
MVFHRKITGLCIMFLLIVCIMPLHSNAKLVITTRIAIGEIVGIQDNVIELEGGAIYYPPKKNMTLNFQPGDLVTIEFYIDPEEKNYYVAVALGENTLSASPPPEQKEKKPIY